MTIVEFAHKVALFQFPHIEMISFDKTDEWHCRPLQIFDKRWKSSAFQVFQYAYSLCKIFKLITTLIVFPSTSICHSFTHEKEKTHSTHTNVLKQYRPLFEAL